MCIECHLQQYLRYIGLPRHVSWGQYSAARYSQTVAINNCHS